MTRLVVHALGAERLLVSGDDGRRWVVDATPDDLDGPAVREVLARLRAGGDDLPLPPASADAVVFGSLVELVELDDVAAAPAPAREARWVFAGRVHRVMLPAGREREVARDVADRLVSTVADPAEAAALASRPLLDEVTPAAGPGARAVPAPEAHALERWLGERGGAWRRHRLDPPPLVDEVTGVLRRIVERPRHPGAPPGFVHLHAELPYLSHLDPRSQPDPLAPAGAFRGGPLSPDDEAILSGVAHESGAFVRQGELRPGSADGLAAAGERVLSVRRWAPHPDHLHDRPGFPFVRDDPAAPTWWLRGADRHGVRWAPLSLVHAGYLASGLDDLPVTNGHNLVGLQAGFTEHEALDRAAAHLIAHDAVARWWATGSPLRRVEPPALVREAWGDCPWRVGVLELPARFGVPVRLAVVDDPEAGIVALGHAADRRADHAALRALADALVQHACARDLDRSDGLIRRAADLGNGGVAGLAEHDPERAYASAFADRRRMVDPMCHVQYGLDPAVVARTRERLEPGGCVADPSDADVSPFAALDASGEEWVRVDVTTPRARAAGAHAVRLLAPGLRRLAMAAFSDERDVYPGW